MQANYIYKLAYMAIIVVLYYLKGTAKLPSPFKICKKEFLKNIQDSIQDNIQDIDFFHIIIRAVKKRKGVSLSA